MLKVPPPVAYVLEALPAPITNVSVTPSLVTVTVPLRVPVPASFPESVSAITPLRFWLMLPFAGVVKLIVETSLRALEVTAMLPVWLPSVSKSVKASPVPAVLIAADRLISATPACTPSWPSAVIVDSSEARVDTPVVPPV